MWADTVIKTIDFSDSSWEGMTFTQGNTTTADYNAANDVTFYSKNSSLKFSITNGALTWPTTASSGNYVLGFPVTGIVGGIITIKVYNETYSTRFRYSVKDGGTEFSTSDCSSLSNANSGSPSMINISGLSDNAFVYIGSQNISSYKQITKIEVCTPEKVNLTESKLYHFFSTSNTTGSDLITNAGLPSYVSIDFDGNQSNSGNKSEIMEPYNFKESINSSSTYYRLKTAYGGGNIVIGGLSHVKSIRIYGNGTADGKVISTTVTKLSGSGSAMTVENLSCDNSTTIIKEYSTGDLTALDGYDENTYYLYTINFNGYFNIWSLYIEPTVSCTSVDAPTGLSCTAHNKNSLTFGWTAAANASNYDVTLYSDSECTVQVATDNVTTTSKTFTGLNGNTTYYCKVQSKGDGTTYCAEGNVTDATSGTTDSKDYTLTVDSNNDSYGTATAEAYSLDEDETTEITAVAETGYKFRSWAVSGTGATLISTTTNPTTFTMGTADATVEATFSALETYTISYEAGSAVGITGSKADESKTEDVAFTLPSSAVFTRSGYVQTGWTTSDGGEEEYALGGSYTTNAAQTFYPSWTEQYTLTYDANGGSGSMSAYEGLGSITLDANTYTKSGYTFIGWATSKANADAKTVTYTDKAAYTLSADATLYAVWAENYCEMKPAISGTAPTAGSTIDMQSGTFGGTMTVESSAATLNYTNYGLSSFSGKTTLEIVLNDYIKPGSVISLTLYAGTAGSRGFDLYTSDGVDKITTFAHASAGYATYQYTVTDDDGLDGTNGFQLKKETYTAMIYLTSLTVTDCQPGGIISESGWNTYSSNKKLDLSTISGGTAYVASTIDNSDSENKVIMKECTAIVNAEEGLMIKGEPGDKFTINTSSSDATLSETNLLRGLPNGGEAPVGSYVFGWPTATPADFGFYYVNSSAAKLGAGKAYLSGAGFSNKARLTITFDNGTTTGMQELNILKSDAYYNLHGQRVNAPQKGIYIVNGKKYINK